MSAVTVGTVAVDMGHNKTVNTLANWDKVTSVLRRVLHPKGRLVAVLHSEAIRELREDLTANYRALYDPDTFLEVGAQLDGFTVYEASKAPPGDTTARTSVVGVVTAAQPHTAPGLAWEVDVLDAPMHIDTGVTFITRAPSFEEDDPYAQAWNRARNEGQPRERS